MPAADDGSAACFRRRTETTARGTSKYSGQSRDNLIKSISLPRFHLAPGTRLTVHDQKCSKFSGQRSSVRDKSRFELFNSSLTKKKNER
jgi:hypothetical protein